MADSLNDALQELDEMSVVTSGDTLVINNDLRTITVPANFIFGVYNDKNVLSVDFEMPRYYDDIDLSTFSIQINYQAASGVGNIYEITTPVIGTDKITFEWLLDRGVFLAAGDVTFIVCLREILSGSDGTVLREFNTTVARGKVLEGLEVEDPEDPEAYSIIAHLKSIDQRVTAQANDVANKFAAVSRMASESTSKYNEAIEAIEGAKEFYGSPLVAATAAGMTDQTKVYVYTGNETGYTFGNWYYYNGSAWVSGGVYNSSAVNTDETLSVSGMAADSKKVGDEISGLKEDLSEITGSSVLHFTESGYLNLRDSPATLTPNTSVAGYKNMVVDCTGGDVFTINGTSSGAVSRMYAFLDSENNILANATANYTANNLVITAPAGTAKVAFNSYKNGLTVIKNIGNFSNAIVELNKSNDKIAQKLETEISIPVSDFESGSINPATGEVVSNVTRIRTINYLSPNVQKMTSNNANYKFMLMAYTDDLYVGYWTGSTWSTAGSAVQFAELDFTRIDYPQYDYKLIITNPNSQTIDTVLESITFISALANAINEVKTELTKEIDSLWLDSFYKSNDDIANIPTGDSATQTLWALYDTLVESGNGYVTKNTLTSGIFTNYEYVFNSGNYNSQSASRSRDPQIAKPIILLTAGVHGFERSCVMATYEFCKALVENTPGAAKLREGFIFKVIPVACPYGFDNNVRWNENGVNINRNYDADWAASTSDPFTADYSGTSAASEPETKVIQNWIDENTDALLWIDYHNSGYDNEVSYLSCYLTTDMVNSMKTGYRYGINNIVGYWKKDKHIVGSSIVYGYTGKMSAILHGCGEKYGNKMNVPTCTLETSWNIASSGRHSNLTIGTGAETLATLIAGIWDKVIDV